MKSHFTKTDLSKGYSIQQAMMIRAACGARATFSAQLNLTNAWENVTCAKCLAKKAAQDARSTK